MPVGEVGWAVKPSVLGFAEDWEGGIARARDIASDAGLRYLVVDAEFEQHYPPPTVVQDLLSSFGEVRLVLTIQALSNAGVRLLTALGKRRMLTHEALEVNLVRGNDAYLSPAEKARSSLTAMRRCLGVLDRYHATVWVGSEGPRITSWAIANHNAGRLRFFALMNRGLPERLAGAAKPCALYTLALHASGDGYRALAEKVGAGYFLRRPWLVEDLKARGIDPAAATLDQLAPFARELGLAGGDEAVRSQLARLPPMDTVVFYVPEKEPQALADQLGRLGRAVRAAG